MIGRPHVNKKGDYKPVFCAGGDVKSVYLCGKENTTTGGYGHRGLLTADFFREEYAVNHAIATQYERTKIPQISIWNGIVMGGGVGLSIHGSYRVATEHTIFAMPESAIGLFPDVGGMWFLPRLNEEHKGLGLYLALTGHKLTGVACMYAGLSTHYISSKKLEKLYEKLIDATITNVDVIKVLDAFHEEGKEEMAKHVRDCFIAKHAEIIEKTFYNKDSVEHIMTTLEECQGERDDFSVNTLATLKSRSPTSLKVTFEGMRRGLQAQSIGECLQMEFRMSQAFMRPGSDFYEGIRAVLVDKDNAPKWNPSSLEELSEEQVESYFESLGGNEWQIPRYNDDDRVHFPRL